ncbi:hypothetical protein vseg_006916 [Gypsophila vaccaria]
MKPTPKLIVLHPPHPKPTTTTHRFILLTFLTLSSFTFLLTLLTTTTTAPTAPPPSPAATTTVTPFLSAALLHYAAATTTMSPAELASIAAVLRRCHVSCQLLVFGLGPESLLWMSLNAGDRRRTVFVDESEYAVSAYERNHSRIEAYDVAYATNAGEWKDLLRSSRKLREGPCGPSQNLLFSECRLALTDLPNHVYSIEWDVVIVDGPRGYSPDNPGRMSAIFTAAVLARAGGEVAHVFVHDYGREIERVYSEEFLCKENLVEVRDQLAHFVVKRRRRDGDGGDGGFQFCIGENSSSYSSS